jgi:hypothetical protein
VKTGFVGTDVREFLAVVGVATAGLALAAAAAFMPWYGPAAGHDGMVIEVYAPVATDPDVDER